MPTPDSWLYHYQTLLTGAAAIGAAAIAAWISRGQLRAAENQIAVAREQIDETRRQAELDRSGRLRAARASLPATLSAVCEYALAAKQVLHQAWPTAAKLYPHDVGANQHFTISASVPSFPLELLASLERVVELTDVEAVADRIESLLREVQVFSARTRPLRDSDNTTLEWLADYIIQTAVIYARAETLFDYARRHSETVDTRPLWVRVFAALSSMNIHDGFVFKQAAEQRALGMEPGEGDTRRGLL